VAARHGLDAPDAAVIASGSNVLVHLRPAPVVARVMTGTVVLHGDDPREWLDREVAVAGYAAERGAPVVAPSDRLPPGPHEHNGLWLTFWRRVEHDPSLPLDPAEVGRSLRVLHDALAGYDGELPPVAAVRGDIERLIHAGDAPDAHAWQAELRRLARIVFDGAGGGGQTLHGDATIGNTLRTPEGLLWNDFEDVCRGPVEWDVGGLVSSFQVRGADDAFIDAVLDGYGGPTREVVEPFVEASLLYLRAWRARRR